MSEVSRIPDRLPHLTDHPADYITGTMILSPSIVGLKWVSELTNFNAKTNPETDNEVLFTSHIKVGHALTPSCCKTDELCVAGVSPVSVCRHSGPTQRSHTIQRQRSWLWPSNSDDDSLQRNDGLQLRIDLR
jgi:hypothetical protein